MELNWGFLAQTRLAEWTKGYENLEKKQSKEKYHSN